MEKKNVGFNIINTKKEHKPNEYVMGSLSLENISPVIIDVEAESAVVDVGAMYARSAVEKGIKFLQNKAEVPNAKKYWLVWVTVEHNEVGDFHAGVTIL